MHACPPNLCPQLAAPAATCHVPPGSRLPRPTPLVPASASIPALCDCMPNVGQPHTSTGYEPQPSHLCLSPASSRGHPERPARRRAPSRLFSAPPAPTCPCPRAPSRALPRAHPAAPRGPSCPALACALPPAPTPPVPCPALTSRAHCPLRALRRQTPFSASEAKNRNSPLCWRDTAFLAPIATSVHP